LPPDVRQTHVRSRCTGKERDAETGLDYFGARYFSAAQGRWTTPDWSARPEPVPYASLGDPQTLNLYAYVRNNPLGRADADGHCCWDYIVGFAKGTANKFVDVGKADLKTGDPVHQFISKNLWTKLSGFTPSNADQAAGMKVGYAHGPDVVSVATVFVGPKGTSGEALPNEANVVRGGVAVSENAIATHPTAGVTGASVESAPGKSIEQLAGESPIVAGYGKIRCCTVGDVRGAGGDVVPTPGLSPNHATLTGLSASEINNVLQAPVPNPAKVADPKQ